MVDVKSNGTKLGNSGKVLVEARIAVRDELKRHMNDEDAYLLMWKFEALARAVVGVERYINETSMMEAYEEARAILDDVEGEGINR